jgi:hypothetical protein
MKVLKFNEDSVHFLSNVPEAGMDFYLVTGNLDRFAGSITVAVRSNGLALPIEPIDEIYSLQNMIEGLTMPTDELPTAMTGIATAAGVVRVTLPSGYMVAVGAHQLLSSITLSDPARFFRYTSSPTDGRFSAGQLDSDTYLTTIKDQQFVNSGFGAVGRYALPLPMPASYEHDYTLPTGTQLLVGTVAPQFGQSGGGVEAKTISIVSGVTRHPTTPLDDY